MKKQQQPQEKFKTMIGGHAQIEGIMMRGPQKDAIVCRQNGELKVDVRKRKVAQKGSIWTWPIFRGMYGFFDAQVSGVKALMHSADLSPDAVEEQPSKQVGVVPAVRIQKPLPQRQPGIVGAQFPNEKNQKIASGNRQKGFEPVFPFVHSKLLILRD